MQSHNQSTKEETKDIAKWERPAIRFLNKYLWEIWNKKLPEPQEECCKDIHTKLNFI